MPDPWEVIREALENIGPCDTEAENPHREVWCITHRQKRCHAEAEAKAALAALATLREQMNVLDSAVEVSESELTEAREQMEADKSALENERWYSGVLRQERDAARVQVEHQEAALRELDEFVEEVADVSDPEGMLGTRARVVLAHVQDRARAALSTEAPSKDDLVGPAKDYTHLGGAPVGEPSE